MTFLQCAKISTHIIFFKYAIIIHKKASTNKVTLKLEIY